MTDNTRQTDLQISRFDSSINIELLTKTPENLYLERKGLDKKATEIADEIVGMLNSDGGILAYGITDDGTVQDILTLNPKNLEKYRKLHQTFIEPAPPVRVEEVQIDGKRILLFHVREDNENIYARKDSHNVFKRVGDSNFGPLSIEETDNLRYDKNLRHYEDQICDDFDATDLDTDLIAKYKEQINFAGTDAELLLYRNLAKKDKSGAIHYCNSTVLLFARDPDKYVPSSYVRYTRYSGNTLESGARFNVLKDVKFYGNIPTVIIKTRDFLRAAFSDFYSFNLDQATFAKLPEYPEDAWLEGIVNAVFHRSYNLQGNCTTIKHFDDHIEISNSGPLPSQVNVENIKEQRFSRNPRIGRVLYEMGYVRELNEGVKRIYSSMMESELSDPIYTDKDSIVTLRLENPIYSNEKHLSATLLDGIMEKLGSYNPTKKQIISFLFRKGHGTITEISNFCQIGERAIRNNLDSLIEEGIVVRHSNKQRDKNAQYSFATEDN